MLTVPQAAKRTGKNPETIRRWIRSGRLRSQKVGTQHLVAETDLDALADYEPLDLPWEWTHDDDGNQMPNWEQIIRDDRESH